MEFSSVAIAFGYLLIASLIVIIITLVSIIFIDFVIKRCVNKENEMQHHAAILQQATRRKLSSRRPVSPYRYRYSKPTKSAMRSYSE